MPEHSETQPDVKSLRYVFLVVNVASIIIFAIIPLVPWVPAAVASGIVDARPYSATLVLLIDILAGIGYLTADVMQDTGRKGWMRQLLYVLGRTMLFLFLPAAVLTGLLLTAAYLFHWK